MRELYMKQGQGFLLVFSICNQNSFHELSELREQIIRIKDDDDVPLVVVGNKSDMEEDRVISRATAFELAQGWGSKPYYETSARRRVNVDDVFVNLSRQIIQKESATRGGLSDFPGPSGQTGLPHHDSDRRRRRRRHRDRCIIL